MAYDEDLANRVREALADERAITEQRMFGGLAFLLHGNLALAVSSRGGLLVRVGADDAKAALARPHAHQARMGRRTMKGWVRVEPAGVRTRPQVGAWARRGLESARRLPRKG